MKINSRNNSFKIRLARNTLVFAAGVFGISGVAASIISGITHHNAFAADLNVNRTSLNDIGENQIQIDKNKVRLSNANIVLTGPLQQKRSKCYTKEEIENGTYDAERSEEVSYYMTTKNYCDTLNIVYDFGDSLATGEHNIDGTISLTWINAARDADGKSYDLKMDVDNINLANGTVATRPIALMAEEEHTIRYASQEVAASALSGADYTLNRRDLGASYDVTIRVVESGTNTSVANKNTVYRMIDLDQPDGYSSSGGFGSAGSPTRYAESITLISGVVGDVFVDGSTLLNISNTSFGNNTRFSATRTTNTNEWEKSSVAFLVNAGNFKYSWAGSDCGTTFGWIESKKVTTSTSGDYADKGTVTETDEEVLWKEDKTIVAVPDPGYYVSKITVDGVEITFTPDADGKVTYTFPDVIEDHTIDVQFAPNHYKLTVRYYEVGTENPVAPGIDEDDHVPGDTYKSSPADVDDYVLVERPASEDVTFVDHDIELIYYYGKIGTIVVEYCDIETGKCELSPTITDEGIDGIESDICVEKKFDGYSFVNREGGACIYDKNTANIKFWYKKVENPTTFDKNISQYVITAGVLGSIILGSVTYIAKRRR